jgi:hypothetical protein
VTQDDGDAREPVEEPVGRTIAARHGMSFSQRLRAPDSYGLLLGAIGVIAISAGLVGSFPLGRIAIVALFSVTLLFAFRTSRISVKAQRAALVVVVVAVVVSVAATAGSERLAAVVAGGVNAVLAFGALVAILRRLLRYHVVITGATVAGAACSYLLIGLFFASVYTFLAGISGDPFFAQTAEESSVDFLYFSFITLTTVGYGDLSAAGDLGRMLAAGEALTGQLFLVTVVALVVGNIGRSRR